MTFKASPGRPESRLLGRLRVAALIAVLAGAAGSVGLTLSAGQGRDLRLLVVFTIWAFAPFAALVLAHVVARRWLVHTRATLYCLMLVLTLGSLAIYVGDALRHPGTQDAFVFVLVPLVSWVLIALVIPIGAFAAGRLSRRDAGS